MPRRHCVSPTLVSSMDQSWREIDSPRCHSCDAQALTQDELMKMYALVRSGERWLSSKPSNVRSPPCRVSSSGKHCSSISFKLPSVSVAQPYFSHTAWVLLAGRCVDRVRSKAYEPMATMGPVCVYWHRLLSRYEAEQARDCAAMLLN